MAHQATALETTLVDAPSGPSSPRPSVAEVADKRRMEQTPWETLCPFSTTLDILTARAASHGDKTAISFQLKGDPKAPAHTMTYAELLKEVRRLANALHAAGVAPGDRVAMLLPNLPETMVTIFAAQAIGALNPINPLLEPEVIASILRESGATAVVTLAPFPKTDVAAKAAEAVSQAPSVKTIVEVDLLRYVSGPTKIVAPLLRPKRRIKTSAKILSYKRITKAATADRFTFAHAITPDTVGAFYHTGGTTGTPKLAQHTHRGMVFNSWMCHHILFREDDVMVCALPLFHVLASYPLAMSAMVSGAHLVIISPSGFRGDGVLDNFWKIVERYRVTFLCAVPTAIAALDQREVNADVSSLRYMISGSAPLATALFERFEANTGIKILEGYGMTEATCVTTCNPPDGERRIGSVGFPLPFIEVKICTFGADGGFVSECETDHIGEICFTGPSIFPGYLEEDRNRGVFFKDADGVSWLRTGDLGRVDADGYVWITGRAKDLIIRGGHNIDPGMIEEALAKHPAVALVGAIGQPDAYAGELPCAYVELKEGASVSEEELKTFAAEHVAERAARPAAISVLAELPKTAVGKTFKPALRREALARVYTQALANAGVAATVEVEDDDRLGLVAVISATDAALDEAAIGEALSGFARPWRIAA